MILTSTINPVVTSGTSVPVAILSCEGRDGRHFVRVPNDFEEMKTLAARTFQLPTHGIVLMTSSVDVCRGGEVMLGGDTWEWVKGVVSEMRVSMRDDSDGGVSRPQEALGVASSSKYGARNINHNTRDQSVTPHRAAKPEQREHSDAEEEIYEDRLGDTSAVTHDLPSASDEEEEQYEHGEGEEESTHEEQEEQEDSSRELGRYVDRDERDVRGTRKDNVMKERASVKSEVQTSSPIQLQAGGSQPSSQPQSFDEPSTTERLVLSIAYRGSQVTPTQSFFKIRSTAPVKSALKGACKTFGLDVEHASLKLVVRVDDLEGQEMLFDCDKGDTMGRAGAVAGSKFVIVMDNE